MRYRRAGCGLAVLVLGPLWPELLEALAARYRVIVPDLPARGADVVPWLADFLEGLGLANVTVVAADPSCEAALDLALVAVDQVARLVVVAAPRDTPLTAARAVLVPLLLVPRELPAAEALPLVARFLAGEGAPVPS